MDNQLGINSLASTQTAHNSLQRITREIKLKLRYVSFRFVLF